MMKLYLKITNKEDKISKLIIYKTILVYLYIFALTII